MLCCMIVKQTVFPTPVECVARLWDLMSGETRRCSTPRNNSIALAFKDSAGTIDEKKSFFSKTGIHDGKTSLICAKLNKKRPVLRVGFFGRNRR